MLRVSGLNAGYAQTSVLFDVSFEVNDGEVITLLGRNGMGKTTVVKTIMGLLRSTGGTIRFAGYDISSAKSFHIAKLGIGLVPEGRQVFPTLSVRENLVATAANRHRAKSPWTLDRVVAIFPALNDRLTSRASLLSGGEQQMLAIGRALMTNPKLLVLDEATEGLAPVVRAQIWSVLSLLKGAGQALLVIDKNLDDLMRIATRHYILDKGTTVWSGSSIELSHNRSAQQRYLAA